MITRSADFRRANEAECRIILKYFDNVEYVGEYRNNRYIAVIPKLVRVWVGEFSSTGFRVPIRSTLGTVC